MAAKKKAAPKERYFLVESECGDDAQAGVWGDKVYPSIKAAMESVKEILSNDGYRPSKVYVVKVVAQGAPTGFTWE